MLCIEVCLYCVCRSGQPGYGMSPLTALTVYLTGTIVLGLVSAVLMVWWYLSYAVFTYLYDAYDSQHL